MTSPLDWVRDRPGWEQAELVQAARDFEQRREVEPPLLIDDWHAIVGDEVNMICGTIMGSGEPYLATEVIVGADPERGLVRVGMGWLKLGDRADPVGDPRGYLQLLEAEAEGLRDALFGRY